VTSTSDAVPGPSDVATGLPDDATGRSDVAPAPDDASGPADEDAPVSGADAAVSEPKTPEDSEAPGVEEPDALAAEDPAAPPTAEVEEPGAFRTRRGGPETAGPVSDEDLRPAVEAILLVVDTPVAEMTLAQVLERPTDQVRTVLEELAAEYTAQSRGMDLRQVAGGWRLYTRDAYAPYVERFVLDGQQARLTQAALETLSVVAYRQPVTRARISAIRGVGVDGVIRTLVTRGLIEECGAEHETGAHLYRTTTLFLEKLGLNSLEELPSLAPLLPEIEALDDVIGSA
jgi:segregation and condensation protein B